MGIFRYADLIKIRQKELREPLRYLAHLCGITCTAKNRRGAKIRKELGVPLRHLANLCGITCTAKNT